MQVKSVMWWTLAGILIAELAFVMLKIAVSPTPLNIVSGADHFVFRARIIFVFFLVPILLGLIANGLQDKAIQNLSRQMVVGGFMVLALGVHLFVIRYIFGKPRPEVLKPYEFSLEWFYFFTWGMGGMLIGLGLVSLYSLLFTKRPDLPAAAAG